MMTPPIFPRRARLSKDAEGVVPSMLTMSFWPIISFSVGAEATAGADDVDAVRAATARPRAGRRESRVVTRLIVHSAGRPR
jgi:hypothetical protein